MSFKIVTLTLAAITMWAIVPEDANACHRKRARQHRGHASTACCPSQRQTVATYQPTYAQSAPAVSSGCCGSSYGTAQSQHGATYQGGHQGNMQGGYPMQSQGTQSYPYSSGSNQQYGNQQYDNQGQLNRQGTSGNANVGANASGNAGNATGNLNAQGSASGNANASSDNGR